MKPLRELSAKQKAIELLRWLSVAPLAVLVGMAPVYISRLLIPPALALPPGMPRPPASEFQQYYLPHLVSILMATAFVVVGAKVAPRARPSTAAVLVVIWMLYAFAFHVLPHDSWELRHYGRFVLGSISAVAAATYVWFSENDKRPSRMPSEE